jgi:hypothetical protein
MHSTREKFLIALVAGLVVTATALIVNATSVPFDRDVWTRIAVGDFIAGLIAALVALAIQLKNDGAYFRFAMERAAIVAELNHHVRNAVFPLCLAVQRSGDVESNRLANEAVERINVALRDAITDAFSRNVDYGEQVRPIVARERSAA